jgi:carbonic anhydrase/acetyltransferase-like protein (isoleucine patch superfamily)
VPRYALGELVPQVHPDAYVHPDAVLIGDVRLASGASVWPGAVLRADDGPVTIGPNTSVQDGSVLHVTTVHPTTVGAGCVVGHVVHLEGCVVGDGVLIGSGSVVLNGARVGDGSLVAAGAVVGPGMEIPPGSVARGVPARLAEGAEVDVDMISAGAANYVARSARYQRELRRLD